MSLDYLLLASRDAAATARMGRLEEESIARRSNVVGGSVRCARPRPGLFVMTVDDDLRAGHRLAESRDLLSGTGMFEGTLVQRGGDLPARALRVPRSGWRRRPSGPVPATRAVGNFLLARHRWTTISLSADLLGTCPIFVHDGGTFFGASNNLYLLERALSALGVECAVDLSLQGYIVTLGNGAFDLTGRREIRMLAPGEVVEIDRENRVRSRKLDVASVIYSERPLAELLDEAAHEILLNVRAIADAPFRHRICDLTGGMDSRLVVAAILHEKRADDFLFFTGGVAPNPDAIAGALIRQRLGLRRVTGIAPPVPDLPLFEGMRYYIHRASGCFSMLYGAGGVGQPDTRDLVQIGGSFGETFRGYYGNAFAPTADGPLAQLIRSTRKKAKRYLASGAIKAHLLGLERFGASMLESGARPDDLPDLFYLRNRTRYHFGAQWRVTSFTRSVFHPLYSMAAIRAAYRLGLAARAANRVGYELMTRFSPELTALPFADDAWHPSLGAAPVAPITRDTAPPVGHDEPGLSLFEGAGASRGASARAASLRAEGRNRKWIDLEAARDEFVAQATEEGYQRLQPLFDPDKVKAYLTRPIEDFTTQHDAWTVYRLMAVFICANRLERPPHP